MTTTARPILPALICLAFLPTVAHAIGFGEIVSQSAIGDPFRAEVLLHGIRPGEDAQCLRVAPGTNADGIPDLRGARVSIRHSGGRSLAVVTRSTPVSDPILRLTLEETCSAQLRRSYTLLLPMRAEFIAPAIVPAPPSAPPQATAPASTRRPRQRGLTTSALGGTWTLPERASINTLAQTLYPASRHDRAAFTKATRDLNAADRSIRSSRQRLAAGTTLALPTPAQIAAARAEIAAQQRTAAEAAQQRAQRPTPLPAAAPPEDAAPPAAAPAPALDAPPAQALASGDRLQLLGDAPDVSGFHLSPMLSDPGRVERTTDAEREALRREQKLVMTLDSQIMARLELSDRIQRLEALQNALKAEMEASGSPVTAPAADGAERTATTPADPQEVPAATTPPRPEPTAPTTLKTPTPPAPPPAGDDAFAWWQPLAIGVLTALLGLMWWRRRQPQAPDEDELDALASLNHHDPTPDEPIEPAETETPGTQAPGLGDSFDFSSVEWDGAPPAELEHSVAPITIDDDEMAEEHASAVELADIMMSFGRVQGAAETLSDFIRANPKQAVQPWLKLLEVYRAAGMQAEFDGLTRQLNKTFNVKVIPWDKFDETTQTTDSVEQMGHIIKTLEATWATRDCQAYIHGLLRDNRGGTREGFPFGVIDDLLMLLAVLEDQLGAYRQTDEELAAALAPTPAAAQPTTDGDAPGGDAETADSSNDRDDVIDLDSPATRTFLPDLDFQLDSGELPDTDDFPEIEPGDTPTDRRPDSDS